MSSLSIAISSSCRYMQPSTGDRGDDFDMPVDDIKSLLRTITIFIWDTVFRKFIFISRL
ncbi:hypothetical protein [Francisella tularensis]|uniref:hypothetical protein n=1 Tax=Francisella tularensis TaxID=263 RepID=UPI001C1F57E5|nr:hypothetical protein [Francisella tularensis]